MTSILGGRPMVDLRTRQGRKSRRPRVRPGEGKACLHCGCVLPISTHFGVNARTGKPKSLCLRCESKRKRIGSRTSRYNSLKQAKATLATLTSANTCAQCGDTRGPFQFFRKDPTLFGKSLSMSQAVKDGPRALAKALEVNLPLCPRCAYLRRREHLAESKRKAGMANPRGDGWSAAKPPPPPARLSVLFPLVRTGVQVKPKVGRLKGLPKNMLELRREGDRAPKGKHTLKTLFNSALLPDHTYVPPAQSRPSQT